MDKNFSVLREMDRTTQAHRAQALFDDYVEKGQKKEAGKLAWFMLYQFNIDLFDKRHDASINNADFEG